MPLIPLSLYRLSARWSYLELQTQFTLQLTMSEALSLNSFLSDLEDPQHRLTLLGAVDRLVWFPVACKLSHMFLNPLVETMDILITIAALNDLTTPQPTLTVSHMATVSLLSSNLQSRCTTADHQQSEVMEVLDHSNHNKLVMFLLRTMLDPLLNPCKVLFLASH
jgi:hypothetical protein